MSKIVKMSLLLVSLFFSTVSFSGGLTEQSVAQLIDAVDKAANNKSAAPIGDAMTDNVKIVMNVEFQGQTQVISPSKSEYLSLLEQGWAQSSNYKYSKSDVTIKIDGDKAFVSANVNESMTIQGQNISVFSKEKAVIELINGKPFITEIVGYTSM